MDSLANIEEGFKSFVSSYCCSNCGTSLALSTAVQFSLLSPRSENRINVQRTHFTDEDLELPIPEEPTPHQVQDRILGQEFKTNLKSNRWLRTKILRTQEERTKNGAGLGKGENMKQLSTATPVKFVNLLHSRTGRWNKGMNKRLPKVIKVKILRK